MQAPRPCRETDDAPGRRAGESPYNVPVSDTTTRGIRIQVESTYLQERSSPDDRYYFFSYTVKITNVGDVTAQLINREWVITDGEGHTEVVRGAGVVGKQPRLAPGESFEYTSFCPLRTDVGSMQGAYSMVTEAGDLFEAVIAPFTLAAPHVVN